MRRLTDALSATHLTSTVSCLDTGGMARALMVLQLCAAAASASFVTVWRDDFDAPTLDASSWTVASNMTHGTEEHQLYTSDEVYVENGQLVIRTRAREAYHNNRLYHFTSGWVDTSGKVSRALPCCIRRRARCCGPALAHSRTCADDVTRLCFTSVVTVLRLIFARTSLPPVSRDARGSHRVAYSPLPPQREFGYGRFSARIKLPVELPALWPAYWLVNDKQRCWPTGAEIDILEAVGTFRNDSVFGTYHWGSACGKDDWSADKRNGAVLPPPHQHFSDDFHNFTAWFNATAITWAVDGAPFVSRFAGQPASLFVPSWPLFTIFNTALSFWAGPQPPPTGGYPAFMRVESVEFAQWDGAGAASGAFPIPVNMTGLRPQP